MLQLNADSCVSCRAKNGGQQKMPDVAIGHFNSEKLLSGARRYFVSSGER
jgi:hypothetical protein